MGKPLQQIVSQYASIVGRFGPDSIQTREIRKAYASNRDFLTHADSLDRLKLSLGGKGKPAKQGKPPTPALVS